MKKNLTLAILACFPIYGFGQVGDTAVVIRAVDSLVQVARGYIDEQKFGEAIRQLDLAETTSTTALGREHPATIRCILRRAIAFAAQGKLLEAEPMLSEAIRRRCRG